MLIESLLAFLHLSAILMMVVFITSEAALCRTEWLNAEVVKRLARVDLLYLVSALLVLLTGIARIYWGAKGLEWYLAQPLLHAKITFFIVITLMAIPVSLTFRRWRQRWEHAGELPLGSQIRKMRQLVMIEAHLMLLIPLFGVLLARGVWTLSP